MKNGALAFRVAASAVVAAGLVAVLSWFSTASFKIDLAIMIVACLLVGYVAGKNRYVHLRYCGQLPPRCARTKRAKRE
jgi:hypothetical protein